MLRAAYRSSSGAPNCLCSLWFIYPCGERPLSRLGTSFSTSFKEVLNENLLTFYLHYMQTQLHPYINKNQPPPHASDVSSTSLDTLHSFHVCSFLRVFLLKLHTHFNHSHSLNFPYSVSSFAVFS